MPRAAQPLSLTQAAEQAFNDDHSAEAIELARRALASDPDDVHAHRILGQALVASSAAVLEQHPASQIHRRQFHNGLDQLHKTAAQFPEDALTAHALGITYCMVGHWDDAIGHFEHAIRNDSSHPTFYQAIVTALCNAGRLSEADQYAVAFYREFHQDELRIWPSRIDTDSEEYVLGGVVLTVTINEEGEWACASEELRVFGAGASFVHAFSEWAHVFHLNYTDFVDSDAPLSPSGEEYAEQLRGVVAR